MYENHANRTRYGDPLYVALEWKGVPNYVDGYAHVWFYSGKLITDAAYFFKGLQTTKYLIKELKLWKKQLFSGNLCRVWIYIQVFKVLKLWNIIFKEANQHVSVVQN